MPSKFDPVQIDRVVCVVVRKGDGERATWMLRQQDKGRGIDKRRRLVNLTRGEVEQIAVNLAHRAFRDEGLMEQSPAKQETPQMAAAIAESIRLTRARPEVREHYTKDAKLFVRFLEERYPGVERWQDLRPSMFEAYIRELEGKGLSFDRVRLLAVPVRAAWRRMANDYPGIRPLPAIRQAPRPPRTIDCLTAEEAAALLDWLRIHRPLLWPMATLQACAGLRMLEAAALRLRDDDGDVNLKAGMVSIQETPSHKPKNAASHRTIPVCREALEALHEAAASQTIRPMSGELFLRAHGGFWTVESLRRVWKPAVKAAAAQLGMPRLAKVPTHRLRATFATTAARMGVRDAAIRSYMGHAARAGDVLNAHYVAVKPEDLRSVSEAMNAWRGAGFVGNSAQEACSDR